MNGPAKVVKTKLFIGNLDPATQDFELSQLFAAYGTVLEASVIKDYGFVHFGSIEEAEQAVAALNNKEFHGKRLRVELSTSTVRHRPGQPESVGGLRNSRGRTAAVATGNGISRYSQAAPSSGVGPMRHSASAWIRNDTRPYDGVPIEPTTANIAYTTVPSVYDRSHAYDIRADTRYYYSDTRDDIGYDIARGNSYNTLNYPNHPAQPALYSVHDYRDVPPETHVDDTSYNTNRLYDRNPVSSRPDPYYNNGVVHREPIAVPTVLPNVPSIDPYRGYDAYEKHYIARSRQPDYLISTGQQALARDYDPYVTAPVSMPSIRHNAPVAYPPNLNYPLPTQHRQTSIYGNSLPLTSYYSGQQRT